MRPRLNLPVPPAVAVWLGALAIAAGIFILYAPSIPDTFVADDFHYVVRPDTPLWRLVVFGRDRAFHRPVGELLLAAENALFGPVHEGYHAVSLILHAGVSWLALALLRRLGFRPGAAVAAAAIFAFHPIQAETVVWTSNQFELLAAGFGLAAVLAVLRARRRGDWPAYALALGLALLAYGSKGTALALPLLAGLALAADRFLVAGGRDRPLGLWRVVPLAVLAGAYLLYRTLAVGELGVYGTRAHLDYDLTAVAHLALYLESMIHAAGDLPLTPHYWMLGLAGTLALLGGRWGILWLAWFVAAILPSAPLYAERFAYLAVLGTAAWAVCLAGRAAARLPAPARAPLAAALLAPFLAWSAVANVHFLQLWRFCGNTMVARAHQAAERLRDAPDGSLVFFLNVPETFDGVRFTGAGIAIRTRIWAILGPGRRLPIHQITSSELPFLPVSVGPPYRFINFLSHGTRRITGLEDYFERRRRLNLSGTYPTGPAEWPEAGDPALKRWAVSPDLGRLSQDQPWFVSRGPDPYLVREGLSLPVEAYGEVEVRLRILADGPRAGGQFYWSFANAPGFSESRRLNFETISDGEPHSLRLNLIASPAWTDGDRLVSLRLDPVDRPAEVRIEWLRLIPGPGPRLYQGRLPL